MLIPQKKATPRDILSHRSRFQRPRLWAKVWRSYRRVSSGSTLRPIWRRHYNEFHPHSSLGYRPPAPPVLLAGFPPKLPRPAPPGALQLAQRPVVNSHSIWITLWGPASLPVSSHEQKSSLSASALVRVLQVRLGSRATHWEQ